MSIAGTTFELADIDAAWPGFAMRAQHVDKEASDHIRRCREGEALCLLCDEGLVILSLELGQKGKIAMVVLLAVSSGDFNAFKRHEQDMVSIAKDLDAQELTFYTDRKGWARLLGKEWKRASNDGFSRGVA